MNALDLAISRSNSSVNTAHNTALRLKEAGTLSGLLAQDSVGSFGSTFRDQSANRQKYGLFQGWLYSAVNALCSAGASQPAHVGKLVDVPGVDEERSRRLARNKQFLMSKMTASAKSIAGHGELEHLPGHPFLQSIEHPNPFQHRWQFVYSFIANLNLTGWGFILSGENDEGQLEMYSLPTTWIQPDHRDGPFSRFKIRNPKDAHSSDQGKDWFTRDQVDFAYLPNPSDPLSALSPATSQMMSLKIDDHIQTSQERFFENGIFPSVVITIGKDPHPEVPSGIRPRLTASQRRQVIGAINKVQGGVDKYGHPAIVDGLIEKIDRLSATQNEMGWEKSEDKVMDRILSAFGVPPFILGKTLPGSYAQAYIVQELFCNRVNTFLDLLGQVITSFAPEENLLAWWEQCEPHDPELERKYWELGVKEGHVDRNEYRAKLGLAPKEDDKADRNKLLESVGGMTGAINLLTNVGQGNIAVETAAQFLSLFFEITVEEARTRIGQQVPQQQLDQVVDALSHAVEVMKQPVQIRLNKSELISQ